MRIPKRVAAWMLAACTGEGSDPGAASAARENLEAMSEVHADDTTDATPATEPTPARAVVSEELPYAEVGNELVYGHFAFPEDMVDPLPGLIVMSLADDLHRLKAELKRVKQERDILKKALAYFAEDQK